MIPWPQDVASLLGRQQLHALLRGRSILGAYAVAGVLFLRMRPDRRGHGLHMDVAVETPLQGRMLSVLYMSSWCNRAAVQGG
jgi:hypothetical protein